MYVFYLDIFLVQNFLVNLILLSLAGIGEHGRLIGRIIRKSLAALAGALMYALFFLTAPGGLFFVLACALIAVPVMVLIAWGKRGFGARQMIRRCIAGWAAAALLEGVTRALGGFRAVLILYVPLRFILGRLVCAARQERGLCELTLILGERYEDCVGLCDSGCLLTMPLTGEPVNIASTELLSAMSPDAGEVIPFNALGTTDGNIEVVCLDEMRIHMKKGVRIIKHPRFGCASETLFAGRPYRVILNAGVIEYE